jgi:hypothetical protein
MLLFHVKLSPAWVARLQYWALIAGWLCVLAAVYG